MHCTRKPRDESPEADRGGRDLRRAHALHVGMTGLGRFNSVRHTLCSERERNVPWNGRRRSISYPMLHILAQYHRLRSVNPHQVDLYSTLGNLLERRNRIFSPAGILMQVRTSSHKSLPEDNTASLPEYGRNFEKGYYSSHVTSVLTSR